MGNYELEGIDGKGNRFKCKMQEFDENSPISSFLPLKIMECRACAKSKAMKDNPNGIFKMDAIAHTCNQPERSKREDVFVIKGSKECIAMDAIPSPECKEYHQNSYIQINGKLKRCGALNSMET